ncbi:MAG: translation initiation factor IF-2 subunit beta [Methanosarcinales archaeon]
MDVYEDYLKRAIKQLPDIKTTDSRFIIPKPKVYIEGKATVLENFGNITDVLNRDPEHVMRFLLRELGTAGKIDGNRAVFQGKFSSDIIEYQIDTYCKEYVICSECERPDTHLVKDGRILTLTCDACGAHRSIRKRYIKKEIPKEAIEEGETYEFRISAVGSKGDGISKVDKYTIFIPNTSKGDIVTAKIKKVSGTLAFADLIERKKSKKG